MRLLGPKASFASFRWDLIYLYAGLHADEERPAVQVLAAGVLDLVNQVQAERGAVEEGENMLVIAQALRSRRDRKVDQKTIEIGGVARAADKATYSILFPSSNPSQVTKMSLDRQLQENKRIAKELSALPVGHDLRERYLTSFETDIVALEKADDDVGKAEVALAFARSKARQVKLQLDKERLNVHAKLVQILGDKKAADAYFRPNNSAPGEAEGEPEGEGEPEK